MTSAEANDAAAEGVRDVHPDAKILQMPVSDGGEGWIEAFVAAKGGKIIEVEAVDPLMRPIKSQYAICGDTADNVYFVSQGYTIGLGTRIAAVAGQLPK